MTPFAFVCRLRDETLPAAVLEVLAVADDVAVSVVTPWELAIKAASGKLEIDWARLQGALASDALAILPLTVADGLAAGALPAVHRDPFDRMVVAQATRTRRTLVSPDAVLSRYGVHVLWG